MHSNTGFEKNTRKNKQQEDKEPPKVKVKTKRIKTKRDLLRELDENDQQQR